MYVCKEGEKNRTRDQSTSLAAHVNGIHCAPDQRPGKYVFTRSFRFFSFLFSVPQLKQPLPEEAARLTDARNRGAGFLRQRRTVFPGRVGHIVCTYIHTWFRLQGWPSTNIRS